MKIEASPLRTVMSNYDSVHDYFGWPSVTRLRDGRLAAAASGFRLHHVDPFGKVVLSFSEDEGVTWSAPTVVIDTPLDDRDSGLLPFGESGLLVSTFNNGIVNSRKSNDNFAFPWLRDYVAGYFRLLEAHPDPERCVGSLVRISHDNGRTFGPIRTVPVTSPHGPILAPDGSFLYVGNLHRMEDGVVRQDSRSLRCCRFTEDGGTELLGAIPPIEEGYSAEEPHAAFLPDGKLIVHIRTQGSSKNADSVFTVYQSESEDGGHTFTTPHSIGVELLGGSPPHLLPDGDTLISVYARRAEPHQLRAAFSRDGGKTWDCDNVIANLPDPHSDFGYPSSVKLKNGNILTVYYGGDPAVPNVSRFMGVGVVYEYPTPVVRAVEWRYFD